MLDHDTCYHALCSRDARFDGRFFVAVATTKIYCRPVCPATPAKSENCTFYLSAAAAQTAGYRPCLRCRPETVADLGAWCGTSNTVSRGLALIAEGCLDDEDMDVEQFAEKLGVSGRHLRRLFQEHVGASPVAVAQTRRVLFAKQLIHETQLPMADIAFAAGFGSVRRFNEVFQKLFQRPPSALRRSRTQQVASAGIGVRLRYRPPYDWQSILAYFRTRAIREVETVNDTTYTRTIQLNGVVGRVSVEHDPANQCLLARIEISSVAVLSQVVTRLRHMFDVAADVTAIEAQLMCDPMLAEIIAKQHGLRVPSAWDGFELAMRAVLGQQVSVEAGRKLSEKLVYLCAPPGQNQMSCLFPTQSSGQLRQEQVAAKAGTNHLSYLFPTASQVVAADLSDLGMPAARRNTLVAVARAAIENPQLFKAGITVQETVARLQAIKGIGAWTANYIALRAAREPDAFPAADAVLLRVMEEREGVPRKTRELTKRAAVWQPWRAYAAQHLWNSESEKH